MSQPINDRAIELLIALAQTTQAAAPFREYGTPDGIREDLDQLTNDAFTAIASLKDRAHKLRVRIEKQPPHAEATPTA